MGKTGSVLQIDSVEKIFNFLKKNFGEEKEPKKVITGMSKYSVVELIIPSGSKAYECSVGLRIKSSDDKQVLCVWTRTPMGTEDTSEINVFDPKPFLTLEIFNEGIKTDIPQLKIEYEVRTVTHGALPPFMKIIEIIQSAISSVLLS
ncbi:MAG TPA: hypothetical protein VMR49_03285 [Candidatus Paceibacterota bacterium]|nr:hypothetical protein [Candidatus Paceibacterota bacterium]